MLLLYLYFNILLLLSYFLYLLYTVNQFSFTHFRYCVSTFSYKHMPQCKFSLYLKKAGLASRNIVHFLKKVILRCIGLCFNYHHLYLLSRLDQPLIQRIPAGLSSTVACLDITKKITPVLQAGPLGSLDTLPRLRSLLQTKMAAVQSKRTSLENRTEK